MKKNMNIIVITTLYIRGRRVEKQLKEQLNKKEGSVNAYRNKLNTFKTGWKYAALRSRRNRIETDATRTA